MTKFKLLISHKKKLQKIAIQKYPCFSPSCLPLISALLFHFKEPGGASRSSCRAEIIHVIAAIMSLIAVVDKENS